MLNKDDYEALEETIYLLSIPGMRESIEQAKNEDIERCLSLEDIGWEL